MKVNHYFFFFFILWETTTFFLSIRTGQKKMCGTHMTTAFIHFSVFYFASSSIISYEREREREREEISKKASLLWRGVCVLVSGNLRSVFFLTEWVEFILYSLRSILFVLFEELNFLREHHLLSCLPIKNI